MLGDSTHQVTVASEVGSGRSGTRGAVNVNNPNAKRPYDVTSPKWCRKKKSKNILGKYTSVLVYPQSFRSIRPPPAPKLPVRVQYYQCKPAVV